MNTLQDVYKDMAVIMSKFSNQLTDIDFKTVSDFESKEAYDEYVFKEQVKCWVKMDNLIAYLNKPIKELKEFKTDLDPDILNYMQEKEAWICELQDGKLIAKRSKTTSSWNTKNIKGGLENFFSAQQSLPDTTPQEKAIFMYDYISDTRDVKDHCKLERTVKKDAPHA